MLDLNELNQLVEFADLGTLSKVAEQEHISTPSLTRSMKHLEESFGVPPGHELAKHAALSMAEINGFDFLLRTELGFWDALCRRKMPSSRFLVQTDEATFTELVNSSSLPCFTTDYFKNAPLRYPGRVFIPLTDPEADATFYLARRRTGKKSAPRQKTAGVV